jgi:hypothetical protein
MRGLSETFIRDLKEGTLKGFLEAIKTDDTLCLEIRNNYLNIYYRGGNICKIEEQSNEIYKCSFDSNYAPEAQSYSKTLEHTDYAGWINGIPKMKTEMDTWFSTHHKIEREVQQLILRENNAITDAGIYTDYFIADIEYADSVNGMRPDMLAVRWPADGVARRKGNNWKLAVIEVKYGEGAMKNGAGINKHFTDMVSLLGNEQKKQVVYEDTLKTFNQKSKLGLLTDKYEEITYPKDTKPEFIFIFANTKPRSTILINELGCILSSEKYEESKKLFDTKIATASHMGYGLYCENIMPLEEFMLDTARS